MNRRLLPIITAVAMATALPLSALAQWTGAPGTPPNSNAKGPVWLQTGAPTAQVGKISISEGRINSATHTQDLYISTGKSLRSFGANAGTIDFGNFETGATSFTLGVRGVLNVPGFSGGTSGQICLNGSCISAWPGAVSDIWVNTTGDTMTGSLTIQNGQSLCLGGVCNSSWPSGGISGFGSANYVPRFLDGTTLGLSTIQDNGSSVTIPNLTVSGQLSVSNCGGCVSVNAGGGGSNTGVMGTGGFGVIGNGVGSGSRGIQGLSSDSAGGYGGIFQGGYYGTYGSGAGIGVYGQGAGGGGFMPAGSGVVGHGTTYGVFGQGGSYGVWSNGANAGGNTAWVNFSDRRIKENIHPLTEGLDLIEKIKPVEFEYNGKANTVKGKKSWGIIAQDMLPLTPNAIVTNAVKLNPDDKENTDLYAFESSSLIYVLVNAVKEQQKQIEDLKTQVHALQGN